LSRLLPPLLALVYLAAAQAAVFLQSDSLALLAGFALALLVLSPALIAGRAGAWLVLIALAAGLFWLHRQSLGLLPLYAPPVLLNAFLAWLFGHTLVGARRPLIERVIRAMKVHPEPLDPAIAAYARRLTLAWTLFFIAMGTISLLLALFAEPGGLLRAAGLVPPFAVPQAWWSLFANLLNYLLVGVFFVVEFAYRRRRFDDLPYRNLGEFVRQLARLGPGFWRA
jgi:uncharacterized membrane protein